VRRAAAPAPEGGWARHLFYDTGDGTCIAFWDAKLPVAETPPAAEVFEATSTPVG